MHRPIDNTAECATVDASSIEDDLMESSDELILEASCWPAH